MRRLAMAAVVLLFLPAACGRRAEPGPQHPVVLWRSTPAGPEFPLPHEARWVSTYQRLRCKAEQRRGKGYRWTCFSSGSFDEVLRFYAAKFGVRPESVKVDRLRAADYLETVRSLANELGHRVPDGERPKGTIRVGRLGPSKRLPLVQLESPWMDLDTGRMHLGTLISMRWHPDAEGP